MATIDDVVARGMDFGDRVRKMRQDAEERKRKALVKTGSFHPEAHHQPPCNNKG